MIKDQVCSVEDCDSMARYKPCLCQKHYLRNKRYGRLHSIVNRGSGYTISSKGYVYITVNGKAKLEHLHLAELALGKPLPAGAEVHHLNGKPWDNRPENLVICPNKEYHTLLHKRMRELGYEDNQDA